MNVSNCTDCVQTPPCPLVAVSWHSMQLCSPKIAYPVYYMLCLCAGSWKGQLWAADEDQRQPGAGGAGASAAGGLLQTADTAAAAAETVSQLSTHTDLHTLICKTHLWTQILRKLRH